MSGFTRTHGDFKQVAVYDAAGYTVGSVNAATSAVTVQPQGPKLEFFTLTGNGSQIIDNLAATFQTVQQLATVHIYEYTDATDDTLAIAVYPVGAWTTGTLNTAFSTAWTSSNVTASYSATFTN